MNVKREPGEPVLGEVDKEIRLTPLKATPINDKGVRLSCNNLPSAVAEITAWELAMDTAIGIHFNEWDIDRKLGYMENNLIGNAKLCWQAFKKSAAYQPWYDTFVREQGNGPLMGAVLRRDLCGIIQQDAEDSENSIKVWTMLQKMEICQMAKLPEYNSAFLRLFLMYGDVGNKELLRLYFTKLPSPWGQDTIGMRMALVEKKLEDYCLDWRMRKAAKENNALLCSRVEIPALRFGCTSKGNPTTARKKKTYDKNYKPKWKKSKKKERR